MEAKESGKLLCYNKGCGIYFDPNDNKSDSCTFHPGAPFFHDAYKGWSCCNKKSTDFTEFLNTKGCTKDLHSNVKPPEPEKVKASKPGPDEVITYTPPTPKQMERPSEESSMIKLNSTIAASLKSVLAKLQPKIDTAQNEGEITDEVTVGMTCKNNACKKAYEGPQSNADECLYHPGSPVFHEGMKYWSCCQRKTSEFSNFLAQEGCATGKHLWFKKRESDKKHTSCRYDWHQTGSDIIVSIYAKVTNPELSYVRANQVKLDIHLVFGQQQEIFDSQLILFGVIETSKSKVCYYGTKVEITMKKAEPLSWGSLCLPDVENLNVKAS